MADKNPYEPDRFELTRRDLFKVSLPVILGVGVGVGSTGCGASVPTQAVVAGPLDALEAGPQRMQGYDVFLIRTEQGVAAVSGRCPHAGCGVNAQEGGFRCGCHGSEFAEDGTVTTGPAQQDLTWFEVRIEDGEVVVDPTHEVAKGTFTAI